MSQLSVVKSGGFSSVIGLWSIEGLQDFYKTAFCGKTRLVCLCYRILVFFTSLLLW